MALYQIISNPFLALYIGNVGDTKDQGKLIYISGLARLQGKPKSNKKLSKTHLKALRPKMTPGNYNT